MDGVEWASSSLRAIGLPVAPHVAGEIAVTATWDRGVLREMAGQLTPEHLAGTEVPPETLPAGPVLISKAFDGLDELSTAGRRLLMTAAFSVVDSSDVVLLASAAELDDVVSGLAAGALQFTDGTFRFSDPCLRLALRASADPEERIAIHRGLAKALDARGYAIASWHHAKSGLPSQADLGRRLLHLGTQLMRSGNCRAAFYALEEALARTGAEARGRAELLRGQAALMAGYPSSAVRSLTSASNSGDHAVREAAASFTRAADALIEPSGLLTADVLARHVLSLEPAVATSSDAARLHDLIEIAGMRRSDGAEKDRLQARLYLADSRSVPDWPWSLRKGAISPVVEALVRTQQVSALMQAGDLDAAAAVFRNALPRLPLSIVAADFTGDAARLLKSHLIELSPTTIGALSAPDGDELPVSRPVSAEASAMSSAVTRMTHMVTAAPPPRTWHAPRTPSPLTSRQQQIAELVAKGRTNREIGEALEISERTVEVHLSSIYRKVRVRGRLGLASLLLTREPYESAYEKVRTTTV